MKMRMILESIDEISLSVIPNTRLELELSQSNIFQNDTSPILNTDYLLEGNTNKYYTDGRVEAVVSRMLPEPPFIPKSTDDIEEGANLYYTDERAITALQTPLSTKLDTVDYVQHFRGLFSSYTALSNALPTALNGDYAHIDSGSGFDRMVAIWDMDDSKWLINEVNVLSNTDELTEGSNNLFFKGDRVRTTPLTGLVPQTASPIVATDQLLVALAKLQAQYNNARINNTDELSEGVTNKYFKPERVLQTTLTGLTPQTAAPIATNDDVLKALAKLQAQILNPPAKTINWVDLKTLPNYAFSKASSTSQIEFADIDGYLWIRGSIIVNGGTNNNFLFYHASPKYRVYVGGSDYAYMKLKVSLTEVLTYLELYVSETVVYEQASTRFNCIGTLPTGNFKIPPTCLGKLVGT